MCILDVFKCTGCGEDEPCYVASSLLEKNDSEPDKCLANENNPNCHFYKVGSQELVEELGGV